MTHHLAVDAHHQPQNSLSLCLFAKLGLDLIRQFRLAALLAVAVVIPAIRLVLRRLFLLILLAVYVLLALRDAVERRLPGDVVALVAGEDGPRQGGVAGPAVLAAGVVLAVAFLGLGLAEVVANGGVTAWVAVGGILVTSAALIGIASLPRDGLLAAVVIISIHNV